LLRFASLSSGSGGNATLVEAWRAPHERPTRLLVDCGLGPRRLRAALQLRGCDIADLDAVFLTHEHSDHVAGVRALQRRFGTTVWASAGTWSAVARPTLDDPDRWPARLARHGEAIDVGDLKVQPFAVPHDAAEPLQLVCSFGRWRLGIVTDIGEPVDAVAAALAGCDALLLECNHDAQMLAEGAYPAWLKRRIGGLHGHLSNAQSTALLAACRHAGLRHVVAAHLSLHNNTPALALAALAQGLRADDSAALQAADARAGCDWVTLD
jgi:phosphoribosyl 1,2-cyclic phosphodiesterase